MYEDPSRPDIRLGTRASRTDLTVDAIRRAILTGHYVAGEALTESRLALDLGTSKTPVREALKILSQSGLVTSSSGYRRMQVRTVDEDLVVSVFDLRMLLELEAIDRSVRRGIPGAELEGIARALDRIETQGAAAERNATNRAFHRLLYSRCGNPLLQSMIDELTDVMSLIIVTIWTTTHSWASEASEHRQLLEDARAGDADQAVEHLRIHMATFEQRALSALRQRAPEPRPAQSNLRISEDD